MHNLWQNYASLTTQPILPSRGLECYRLPLTPCVALYLSSFMLINLPSTVSSLGVDFSVNLQLDNLGQCGPPPSGPMLLMIDLPEFSLALAWFHNLFIYFVHNISQCFPEKQNQLNMCIYVCVHTYVIRNWLTTWRLYPDLESWWYMLQSTTRPKTGKTDRQK